MREDLAKVLTERPRNGSRSRNHKTGFHDNNYDDGEQKEDKYSMPKKGKMLMGDREEGPWSEDKSFTDLISPLEQWVISKVDKNWDKVYSEIKKVLPNTNKQNHHLIDTHLFQFINKSVTVVKTPKGRKVYGRDGYWVDRELRKGAIYVDPDTHVLMKYKGGKKSYRWRRPQPLLTRTGYTLKDGKIYLGELESVEQIKGNWIYRKYQYKIEDGLNTKYYVLMINHPLSKKELKFYGIENDKEEKK